MTARATVQFQLPESAAATAVLLLESRREVRLLALLSHPSVRTTAGILRKGGMLDADCVTTDLGAEFCASLKRLELPVGTVVA